MMCGGRGCWGGGGSVRVHSKTWLYSSAVTMPVECFLGVHVHYGVRGW
jgi:hypothetical protein